MIAEFDMSKALRFGLHILPSIHLHENLFQRPPSPKVPTTTLTRNTTKQIKEKRKNIQVCIINVAPPSTNQPAPVTKLALGLLKNITTSLTSSLVAILPIGTTRLMMAPSAGSPRTAASIIGVSTQDGQTQLTRTPWGALSRAALRVRPSTACLLVVYWVMLGVAT